MIFTAAAFRRVTLAAGLLAGAGTLPNAPAADWPNWRGPDFNGISRETGWFKTGAGLKTVWEAPVEKGYSAVAVVGQKLYTAGNPGEQDQIVCLDTRTGATLWKYSYACPAGGSYPGPRATPAVSDNRLFMVSREGQVVCLAADTGKEIWSRPVARELQAKTPGWGFSGSPRLQDKILLLNIGEQGVALNPETGATLWSSGPEKSGYSTPVVAPIGGRPLVALFTAQGLVGVELKTGALLWQFPWKTAHDVNAADPLIHEGRILISSGYGVGGALLNVEGEKPVVVWNNKTLRSHFGTPVLWKGCIYGFDGNVGGGKLKCLEWSSGKVLWEYGGFGFGALSLADGQLIILSERGELAIATASPEGYQELARATVLNGTCWTVPVLANGLIYCRNDAGRLLALSASGPQK